MIEFSNQWRTLEPYERLKQMAEQVRPGMCRYQVDRIFTRSNGGIQGQFLTVYNEIPGGRVEVVFDRTGGTCQDENRVMEPPRVFVLMPK